MADSDCKIPDDMNKAVIVNVETPETPTIVDTVVSAVENNIGEVNDEEMANKDAPIAPVDGDVKTRSLALPRSCAGLFIGRRGRTIRALKETTHCAIVVTDFDPCHPEYQQLKVHGSEDLVQKAVNILIAKYAQYGMIPIGIFPNINIDYPISETMQLSMPPCCYVDVVVSAVLSVDHVAVQQVTHPSFRRLDGQQTSMASLYNGTQAPSIGIEEARAGILCVAPGQATSWYRVELLRLLEQHENPDSVKSGVLDQVWIVRSLDYGWTAQYHLCDLRQIRPEFVRLPFQALDCCLANIVPPTGEMTFSGAALNMLQQHGDQGYLMCMIVGYTYNNVPLIKLVVPPTQSVAGFDIAESLIRQGLAAYCGPVVPILQSS